jgi:hypothetical protein
MPAPYKTARQILEDSVAHNRTPYEEVRALADAHAWTDAQTLETLHAVEREASARADALEIINQADTIRASLDAAIQVDHLEDSQINEVLAILERAGY